MAKSKYISEFESVQEKINKLKSDNELLEALANSSILETLTSDSGWISESRKIFDSGMAKKANQLIKDLSEIQRFISYINEAEQKIEIAEEELASSFKL